MDSIKHRDVTLVKFNDNYLVISCDVASSIGELPNDLLKTSGETVAMFTTRVALMETLSLGGKVIAISNTLSCPMNKYGKSLVKGIYKELKKANIKNIYLNGSTEDNFKTLETSIGVTVIGTLLNEDLKSSKLAPGDTAFLLGIPQLGEEVLSSKSLPSYEDLNKLLADTKIKEIIPVGSKGIGFEIDEISTINNLNFSKNNATTIDFKKSAGPASCLIYISTKDYIENKDVIKLGSFK